MGTPGSAGLHPDLVRDYRRSVVAALLFGLPGLIVVADRLLSPPATPREAVRWAVYGFPGFILLTTAFLLAKTALWYRRSTAIHGGRNANPMRIRLARNDKGGLFLELFKLADARCGEVQHRAQLQPPAWDTGGLDGQVVRVRMDEDPRGPIVTQTDRGVLWPAPFGARQNQPKGPFLA